MSIAENVSPSRHAAADAAKATISGTALVRPLSARVCDSVIAVLSVWTLACHAAVLAGGNLYHTMTGFVFFGAAALVTFAFLRGRGLPPEQPSVTQETVSPFSVWFGRERPWERIYAVFGGIAVLLVGFAVYDYLFVPNPMHYWWTTVLVLAAAYMISEARNSEEIAERAPGGGKSGETILWITAIVCATGLLFVHYSEMDDTFYISLAARAADNPSAPVMTQDPMYGIAGMPIPNPAHVVSSHELLVAAFSLISGLEPVYLFHWGIAFCSGLLAPLAFAQLFRVLIPRQWVWGVVATLIVLVAAGDAHRWYGNFLVAKPWFGKSILLFFVVPMVSCYAMAFMQRPTVGRWLLLAMAQIAGLGLSSTAIFVVPVVATLSSLVMVPFDRRGLARVILVMGSAVYVLAAAVWLRSHMAFLSEHISAATSGQQDFGSYPRHTAFGDWLNVAIAEVFGEGRLKAAALMAIALGWMLYPRNAVARRFLILLPLGVFLTLLNPYLERLMVAYVTASTHWRALWIVPVPAIMALALISPTQWGKRGYVVSLVLLTAFALTVPERSSLSPLNYVYVHTPTAKHGPVVMEAAVALNTRVEPGSTVIADPWVSHVIPQLRHSGFPVVPRAHYLKHIADYQDLMSGPERERRLKMHDLMNLTTAEYVPEPDPQLESHFAEELAHYDVRGVALHRSHPYRMQLENALEDSGFAREWENEDFVIWIRKSGAVD